MKHPQIYKVRYDYVNEKNELCREWNPGKYGRRERVNDYIKAVKYRIESKGGRLIGWEIWDTSTSKRIESTFYQDYK